MNKSYIYLKEEEELGEVIEKIRETKDKEIVLVIPTGTKSLSNYINLELLKREIDNLKKSVYLSTDDEKINDLARRVGLQIFLDEIEERQIVDIRPPKRQKEIATETSPIKEVIETPKKQLKFFKWLISVFKYSLILIVFGGFFVVLWQFFKTKAEIIIETEKSNFDINEIITIKEGQLQSDLENKILPGKYLKIEINKTESSTTTGPVFTEQKPLLEVLFLNFSDEDIPLVAGTRLDYQGNIFRTTERIVLPRQKPETPGQIIVTALPDVIKDNDLKINANASLKIVALEGKRKSDGRLWSDVIKAQANKEYNLSSLAKIGSVAPEDITNTKLKLEKSLKDSVMMKLRLENPQSFYIYDPSLVRVEITNISHDVGAKTDKIFVAGKAIFETLVVPKKEFDDFVKNIINKEILEKNKNLTISQLNFEKIEILDLDVQKKTMTVGIKGQAILIPELNLETIKKEIAGKKIEEVNNYFGKIIGIKKITLKIFPQWQDKLPKDYKRIKIRII